MANRISIEKDKPPVSDDQSIVTAFENYFYDGDNDVSRHFPGLHLENHSPNEYTPLSLRALSVARYIFLNALFEEKGSILVSTGGLFNNYAHFNEFPIGESSKLSGIINHHTASVKSRGDCLAVFLKLPLKSKVPRNFSIYKPEILVLGRDMANLGVLPEFFNLGCMALRKPFESSQFPEFFSQGIYESNESEVTICYNLVRRVPQKTALQVTPQKRQWSNHWIKVYQRLGIEHKRVAWVIAGENSDITSLSQQFKTVIESPRKPESLLETVFAVNLAFFNLLLQDWRWFTLWIGSRLNDIMTENSEDAFMDSWERFPEVLMDIQSSLTILKANRKIAVKISDVFEDLRIDPRFSTPLPDSKLSVPFQVQIRGILNEVDHNCAKLEEHEARTRQLLETTSTRIRMRQNDVILQRAGNQFKLGLLSQNIMSSTIIAVFLVLPGIFASTFLSTALWHFDKDSPDFSVSAFKIWLEIAIPLTLISLVLLYIVFNLPSARFVQGIQEWITLPVRFAVRKMMGPEERGERELA